MPSGVITLICSQNNLTELPELAIILKVLETLECSNNNLKYLPKLPESLKKLICSYNNFKILKQFVVKETDSKITDIGNNISPNSAVVSLVKYTYALLCNSIIFKGPKPGPNINNRIEYLEPLQLPNGLKLFECNNSFLSEVPDFPDTLETLCISENNISELPAFPKSLTKLYAFNNNISELPQIHKQIKKLYIHNNPIKYISADNYNIMRTLYMCNNSLVPDINISNTLFYNNSNSKNYNEFFNVS